MLKILGRQNTIIAQLNADSDTIFQQLTDRREHVVDFIDEAEDTARVSAERRDDLSRDFDLLDDFLFELNPVMVELGNLAREQTPLLIDLRAAAPGLNKLAKNLPGFNEGTRVSLNSLGDASRGGQSRAHEVHRRDRGAQRRRPEGLPRCRSGGPASWRASTTRPTPSRRTATRATTSASSPARPTAASGS